MKSFDASVCVSGGICVRAFKCTVYGDVRGNVLLCLGCAWGVVGV